MSDPFAHLDATAQADLVRRKEVTPLELVDAAIARIERLNPELNAVVTPMFEQAREAARGPLPQGPFTGVPFLVKDLLASVAGVRMTSGSVLYRDFVPDHDSELVARFRRAGLVIVGKSNTPEFGWIPSTESTLLGRCRNPWDVGRSAGGSSGGSAAAVAARLVPFAHGNDGGGSIRIPASCCGLFGLKPTRARNSLAPDYGDLQNGLVVEHAVTRSVRDSAALLDATAGPAPGDPYAAPPPARPFLQEVGADPGRLRIALSVESMTGAPIHPDCVAAVHDAAKLCEQLGHTVVEAAPQLDGNGITQAFIALWAAHGAELLDGYERETGRAVEREQVEPLTWALAEMGRQQSAGAYLLAVGYLQRVARQVARFHEEYDLWLTPTLAEPPIALGNLDASYEDPFAGFFRAAAWVPFTPLANTTGQPAMSVPLYWNAEGLPIGAHFFARFGDEATLLRLASQLERARPWADRAPPLSALR